MDWDRCVSELYGKGSGFRYLAYLLDNLYERLRFLVGGRWSHWNKRHVYCGIPMDKVIEVFKVSRI